LCRFINKHGHTFTVETVLEDGPVAVPWEVIVPGLIVVHVGVLPEVSVSDPVVSE
jgi:hypothetical protein